MEILRVENLCKEYGKGQTKVKALDAVISSIEFTWNIKDLHGFFWKNMI